MLTSRNPAGIWRTAAFLSLTTLSLSTTANAAETLEQRLAKFKANPRALLETIPQKITLSGPAAVEFFGKDAIKKKDFVISKDKARDLFVNTDAGRSAIKSNDDPSKLVDNADSMVTNIEDMQKKKLTKGEVKVQPWSDYYWALFNGQTAFRYADEKFPAESEDWKLKNDYLNGVGANVSDVDTLSPAEKYDLLVGDNKKSLTRSALGEGGEYYRSNGSVERWMGICHGWAPAAYMVERPTNAVKVMAADGKTKITFYPSDIKALSSLLWAKSASETRFIGGRCNTKEPKTDKNGRVKDQDCFDTNPGAWHQAIVNQIGVSKRSFVMDVTFDYEVWNQPVKGYSYTYFNPETMKPVKSLKSAVVELKDLKDDKFDKYRSKKAKYVVGISMDVDYIVETFPQAAKNDTAKNDAVKQVSYEYDLELDENMEIVGGEWYENTHPDFLWTPAPDARAQTIADEGLKGKWDGKGPMPRDWSAVAPRAAEAGSPLATVVEALVDISRKNFNP